MPNEELPKVKINPLLWGIPLILSAIGILLITSTTGPTSFASTGTPFQMGMKQLKWLAVAIVTMLFMYSVPLKFWYKISAPLLILTWVITWMPLLPGIGLAVGGARRWIRIPGMSFSIQPGELLCLALALHLAKILSRETDRSDFSVFVSVCVVLVIAALPLLCQPDLGTTILLFFVSMGMYVERKTWKFPLIGGAIGFGAIAALIYAEPYRMRRVTAFIDPWSDPLNKGFHAIQGLIAFANGGLLGVGLGHGAQKLNYLPAAYTDFIYAAIGEELGLVGTLSVLGLFGFWLTQIRSMYYDMDDGFKTALTWGVALTILFPLVINIAGVTKLMPLTGMPLPFITYGGTSLLTMWARVGMMMRLKKESIRNEDFV